MDNALYLVRKWMAKMGIISPDNFKDDLSDTNICYICSKGIESTVCNDCKIDFNEIFICPHLNDEKLTESKTKICNITKKECNINGIDYEICDNYHSVDFD